MHSNLHVFDNIICVRLSSFFCVLSFDAAFVFLQSMDNNTSFLHNCLSCICSVVWGSQAFLLC